MTEYESAETVANIKRIEIVGWDALGGSMILEVFYGSRHRGEEKRLGYISVERAVFERFHRQAAAVLALDSPAISKA